MFSSAPPSIHSSSPWDSIGLTRIILDALLPLVCTLLAIRSFVPPHAAPAKAQSRCGQDPFARFGLVKVPPVLVSALYTLSLVWHVRVSWGDVLSRSASGLLRSWALPALDGDHVLWERMGWMMAGLGGGLRYWCYRELSHFFTFTLAILDDHRIVSSGPYAVVRHPSYTGLFLVASGLTVLMQVLPVPYIGNCPPLRAMIVTILCAYMIWSRITGEEEMMVREFEALRRRRGGATGIHPSMSRDASTASGLLAASTNLHSNTASLKGGKQYGAVQNHTDAATAGGIECGIKDGHQAEDTMGDSHDADVETDYDAYRRKVPWKLVPFLI
ncbi:unnamed protein product [Tilletia controversa]|nr:unnamed protein product [Tilletia controversa]CAD6904460.1 unnamed protein product [Tilletia controversa]